MEKALFFSPIVEEDQVKRIKERKKLGKLQVDGTERAGKKFQLFLGKGDWAIQRALQAGRKASRHLETGVCCEKVEVGQERRIRPLRAGIFGQRLWLQAWVSEHRAAGVQCAHTLQGSGRQHRQRPVRRTLRSLGREETGFSQPVRGGDTTGAHCGFLGWVSRVVRGARPAWLSIRRFPMLRLPLVFHASVLEPYFDLPFGEVQQGGDLHSSRPAQILVEVELLLQLQQLRVGVGRAQPARAAAAAALWQSRAICEESTLRVREVSTQPRFS